MNLPNEDRYNAWRDTFFQHIDNGFLNEEIADWCDDQFGEWLGAFYSEDKFPLNSQIIQFALEMNQELFAKEMEAILKCEAQ
jgi:hypothetical protein